MKMNYLFVLLAATFVLAAVGCKKEDAPPAKMPDMPSAATNMPAPAK